MFINHEPVMTLSDLYKGLLKSHMQENFKMSLKGKMSMK